MDDELQEGLTKEQQEIVQQTTQRLLYGSRSYIALAGDDEVEIPGTRRICEWYMNENGCWVNKPTTWTDLPTGLKIVSMIAVGPTFGRTVVRFMGSPLFITGDLIGQFS